MGSYLRPTTLDDALAALEAGPRLVFAGGTDVYPALVGRPVDDDVLDLSGLPSLRAITVAEGICRIPALATWTDLIRTDLPARFDGLKTAARAVGGVQIQNRGTIAGNLCNASPAADGLPNLMALDARVELTSSAGVREVPCGAFVVGNRRTIRRPDELVTAILVPVPATESRSTFLKLGARAYLVISIAMVAAVVEFGGDDRIVTARLVVGACSEVPLHVPAVEARLVGRTLAEAAEVIVDPADVAHLSPIDDVRAPAAYRREAALVLIRRAIGELAR